jgi:hypothetical protein
MSGRAAGQLLEVDPLAGFIGAAMLPAAVEVILTNFLREYSIENQRTAGRE